MINFPLRRWRAAYFGRSMIKNHRKENSQFESDYIRRVISLAQPLKLWLHVSDPIELIVG